LVGLGFPIFSLFRPGLFRISIFELRISSA
jgi:hypothetical protein